ncbi:hypothetical protein [Methyloceanibacter stevinii]|uniref:hypothetical protein n=1 Tax=Methyloceanibacter stevinii TaxID=1774970 RepID=UPI001FCCF02D|nr:hypothetical protein [Methyloceanibacter stevinii]
MIQTNGEMFPTVAAMAPTVNSTKAGVPAANQNACFQSMSRLRLSPAAPSFSTACSIDSVSPGLAFLSFGRFSPPFFVV